MLFQRAVRYLDARDWMRLFTAVMVVVVIVGMIPPFYLFGVYPTKHPNEFCDALYVAEQHFKIEPLDDTCCLSDGMQKTLANQNWKFKRDGYDTFLNNYVQLDERSMYFELGAFDGTTSRKFYDKFRPRMFLVEPSPRYFSKMEQRFAGVPNVTLLNAGIGAQDGKAYLYDDGYGSYVTSNPTNAFPIRLVSWQTIFDSVGTVDLAYVNCEGCEYIVLGYLTKEHMRRVKAFYIQFHKQYQDDAPVRRCEMRRKLRETHRLVYQVTWVWEIWILDETQRQ
jgi:FkbM family methyltransferase